MDNSIVQTIVAVILAVLSSNGLWAWLQSRSKTKSASERMILGLGHAEIFRLCEKYIRRGAITMEELEDREKYLFKPYAEMGGNGTAAALVKKCQELPFVTQAVADRMDTEIYAKKGDADE